MAYVITEYPDYDKLAEGEILVVNETKGLWQIIPDATRPYNLVYLKSNNNICAIRDLSELDGQEYTIIRMVT